MTAAAAAPVAGGAKQEEEKIQRNPGARPRTNKLKTNKDKKKQFCPFRIRPSRQDLRNIIIFVCSFCKKQRPLLSRERRRSGGATVQQPWLLSAAPAWP